MQLRSQISRNLILNWMAFATSITVAFFLSPFIVHSLGNVAYGVWTLVISMVSYMGLLDLGLRGAVTRFVSRYHAQGDHAEASANVSAALWLRLWIGLVILGVTLILPTLARRAFPIPAELQSAATLAIIVTGINFGVTITFGVFGAVLAGLQRFDIMNGIVISQTVLRASGVVYLLRSGHGISALALWELFVVLLANTSMAILTLRVYPQLKIIFRMPSRQTLGPLWEYSFYVLLMNVCWQVIQYTDNVVVGAFVSVAAVTFCSIAVGLYEYTRSVVGALGMIFLPLASSLDAQGRKAQLRTLLIQGTRATLLVALPIQLVLFFSGHTFIRLWVGAEYAEVSGRLLQILMIAQLFTFANYASHNIACGLGKHKTVAARVLAEAIANITLSIILIRQIGLNGVAWGSAIPSVVIQLLFWPRFISKLLESSMTEYVWQSWIKPCIAAIPFGLACYLADRYWVPASLFHFFLHVAAILPIFAIGVAICFWKEVYIELAPRFKWLDPRSSGAAVRS
jgi:O-antigen/teichoic acid export membrane protein